MIDIDLLEKKRIQNKLSVAELCKCAKISTTSYYNCLKNRSNPSMNFIIKLADYYKISIDEIVIHNDN